MNWVKLVEKHETAIKTYEEAQVVYETAYKIWEVAEKADRETCKTCNLDCNVAGPTCESANTIAEINSKLDMTMKNLDKATAELKVIDKLVVDFIIKDKRCLRCGSDQIMGHTDQQLKRESKKVRQCMSCGYFWISNWNLQSKIRTIDEEESKRLEEIYKITEENKDDVVCMCDKCNKEKGEIEETGLLLAEYLAMKNGGVCEDCGDIVGGCPGASPETFIDKYFANKNATPVFKDKTTKKFMEVLTQMSRKNTK